MSWSTFQKNLSRQLYSWRRTILYTILSQKFRILILKLGLRALQKRIREGGVRLIFEAKLLRTEGYFGFRKLWKRVICFQFLWTFLKNLINPVFCMWYLECGQEFAEWPLLQQVSKFHRRFGIKIVKEIGCLGFVFLQLRHNYKIQEAIQVIN